MKFLFLLFVSITFFTSRSIAQQSYREIDPTLYSMTDDFFSKYKRSPSDALDHLFSTNNSFTPQVVKVQKDSLVNKISIVGAYNGYELITVKRASRSLILFSYLVKHDKQPLRFNFIFYNVKDAWKIYKFTFDDGVGKELEEAGKIRFIQQ